MNEYLPTTPFDLYELHLFQLVAKHRSFTKAAEAAGLTQSAVTRQVQGVETSLGLALFERTTRTVRLTPAGEALARESARLLGDVDRVLQTLREDYAGARKVIRVGVSRSVGLAYLPGFFHANLRRSPEVGYRVSNRSSADILVALESNELDLGVLCPPARISPTVRVTHRFKDSFVLIGSVQSAEQFAAATGSRQDRLAWLAAQPWLMLDENTNTGRQLRTWLTRQGCRNEPAMQLDSFDLIINLVSLGMGVGFVPARALALYHGKRTLRRIPWPERFARELVVAVRRNRELPGHLSRFIDNILF